MAPPVWRSFRVFISSTFRDMQAEREVLVKQVFPQLRKRCELRGVTFREVDLRWGVTEDQARRGEVLPICLAEIDRCRPFFIGLLGERYGWVPDAIPGELAQQNPWLRSSEGCSLTEMEILHGVLNDPALARRARFYFRDSNYIDSLSEGERNSHREAPSAEEIAILGPTEAQRRAGQRAEKQARLKDRIRSCGAPVRENYPDPNTLGTLVLDDLLAVLDAEFPASSTPDAQQRESAEHDAFAQSRLGVHVGAESYLRRLDEYAAQGGRPPVVIGESGAGKSALLSNWAFRHREAYPNDFVLTHFVGASPKSTHWAALARRMMNSLQQEFKLPLVAPSENSEIRAALASCLHAASAQAIATGRRIILVVDALDGLQDRDGAQELVWLPSVIPEGIRLVISTLPGKPLESLRERGWPILELLPLAKEERVGFIADVLRLYGKELSPARASRIAVAPQSANPSYLRTVLNELRVFGVHERLDERIGHFLQARTVPELYRLILQRWEGDYERDRPGLVRDAMTLLCASHQGLTETELLELLGSGGTPLPQAYWSPLLLAAEEILVNRAGILSLSHAHFREAIEALYLSTPELRAQPHLRLAEYFAPSRDETHQEANNWEQHWGILADYSAGRDFTTRRVAELPWQLAATGSWELLRDCLADLSFLAATRNASEDEILDYWEQVERHSPLRMLDAYRSTVNDPGRHNKGLWELANLLSRAGRHGEAERLREHLVEHCRESADPTSLQRALGNHAFSLAACGRDAEALRLLKEREGICRERDDKQSLVHCLGFQATLQRKRGKIDEALRLHAAEELIYRELGDRDGLQASWGNQSLLRLDAGDVDGALRQIQQQERLCREINHLSGLVTALANRAHILSLNRDQHDEALPLAEEAQRLSSVYGLTELQERCAHIAAEIRSRAARRVAPVWRDDPLLRGRFYEGHPDDLEVVVHEGGPKTTRSTPEVMWVRVHAKRGTTYVGTLLNQPHQLKTVHSGDEILFVVRKGFEHPFRVTEQYVEDRKGWSVEPCGQCNLPELFDPPSVLAPSATKVPRPVAAGFAFVTVCPACRGQRFFSKRETSR